MMFPAISKCPYLNLILVSQVSRCLPMFASVTVKSQSEPYRIKALELSESPSPEPSRSDLNVVAVLLAEDVVAEPLVAAFQPIAWCRTVLSPSRYRDYPS
jgi:hypothetical protein